jgi:hypothetical protein
LASKGEAKSSYSRLPVQNLLQRLIHAPTIMALLWPLILVIGGYIAWQRWGSEQIAQKFYGLDPEQIHVTQPTGYIQADIVSAVYRDTKLDQLSLLDPSASARIASAFASHPWVSRVLAVRKLPGGVVDVHVQYRSPVAMVFVISRHPEVSGRSFFAVDDEGVLLPTTEFTRDQTMSYPHIEIPDVYPTGGVGSGFGDPRVIAAAKLASLLFPYRESLKLRSIQLDPANRNAPVPQFQFVTRDGQTFPWGSAPGQEMPGEPRNEDKLRSLLAKSGDQGSTRILNSRNSTGEPSASRQR